MSGAYDLMLEVQAESLRTLANFVSQKLATIDSVLSTATHFSPQEVQGRRRHPRGGARGP